MIQPISRYFRKNNRSRFCNTYENKSCQLCFGTFGIQAIEKGYLTVEQIEAVRRTRSSPLKRKGKIWIRAYPDSPHTSKPKEVRMGKGKGNVDFWFCHVKPGRILFEIAVSRRKIAVLKSTFRFALIKLPVKAQIITRNLTN